MMMDDSVSPYRNAYRRLEGRDLSSIKGHESGSVLGNSISSPRSSSSLTNVVASSSTRDSEESKGRHEDTLNRSRSNADSDHQGVRLTICSCDYRVKKVHCDYEGYDAEKMETAGRIRSSKDNR